MKKLASILFATAMAVASILPVAAEPGVMITPYSGPHMSFVYDQETGNLYWYECEVRQGVPGDPKNIWDEQYGIERGREIYDPKSNGWYWLDACYGGAVAKGKEVWMPYIYQDEKPGSTNGKWVRYDSDGKMAKGWCVYRWTEWDIYGHSAEFDAIYYYDKITGEMYKGPHKIDGHWYSFDATTGVNDHYDSIAEFQKNNPHLDGQGFYYVDSDRGHDHYYRFGNNPID